MYLLKLTGQYKKDIKLCNKRNYDLSLMSFLALNILKETGTLPIDEYKTYKLIKKKEITWDVHLEPDWLLLYRVVESDDPDFDGVVVLERIGTHSDLFKK